jgi:FAD/FMN-containing dehydrogenase
MATRRAVLLGGAGLALGAGLGAAGARAVAPERPSLAGAPLAGATGRNDVPLPDAGVMNDASLLSPTPVHRHAILSEDPGEALVAALRRELAQARAEGRPVSVGAARHSMGAHALPRDGRAVTFDNGWVEADRAMGLLRVHAGARWAQVIAALDPLGLSPKVMQSNHDFGVAATFSVNAHGWATAYPPMGATVRAVEMVLADGSLVTASRTENADLFRAAMGGYGLLGIVTQVELEAVPNELLEPDFAVVGFRGPSAGAAGPQDALADLARTRPMAYGRLPVDREGMFREALLVGYRPVAGPDAGEVPPVEGSGALSRLSRHVFRAQTGNEWVKRRRWWMETGLGPRLAGPVSRNTLLNEPVATLDDREVTRTDILHEYFVPPGALPDFLAATAPLIAGSYQELLNVTLRWVEADPDAVLAYAAGGARIALVMLFSQEMTARAEADMARMTQGLIDAALDLGGSYYLPYRPHATTEQFRRAYPRWEEFAALKRRFDPDLVLRNGFWDRYLAEA